MVMGRSGKPTSFRAEMQYILGRMLHFFGLHSLAWGIACTVNLTVWKQAGSNHRFYKEIYEEKKGRIAIQLGLYFRPSSCSQTPAYSQVN